MMDAPNEEFVITSTPKRGSKNTSKKHPDSDTAATASEATAETAAAFEKGDGVTTGEKQENLKRKNAEEPKSEVGNSKKRRAEDMETEDPIPEIAAEVGKLAVGKAKKTAKKPAEKNLAVSPAKKPKMAVDVKKKEAEKAKEKKAKVAPKSPVKKTTKAAEKTTEKKSKVAPKSPVKKTKTTAKDAEKVKDKKAKVSPKSPVKKTKMAAAKKTAAEKAKEKKTEVAPKKTAKVSAKKKTTEAKTSKIVKSKK